MIGGLLNPLAGGRVMTLGGVAPRRMVAALAWVALRRRGAELAGKMRLDRAKLGDESVLRAAGAA